MAIQSKDTIAKLGNAMSYLASNIPLLSKTKLLKLLYLLEECSVKKYNSPFFGIDFQIWKLGPVVKDVYIDLSNDKADIFKDYVEIDKNIDATIIKPIAKFNDDEFSDNDIDILEYVLSNFGKLTANELIGYTHNNNSAWSNQVKKENLDILFNNGISNSSDITIDFTYYLSKCSADKYIDIYESKKMFDVLK